MLRIMGTSNREPQKMVYNKDIRTQAGIFLLYSWGSRFGQLVGFRIGSAHSACSLLEGCAETMLASWKLTTVTWTFRHARICLHT